MANNTGMATQYLLDMLKIGGKTDTSPGKGIVHVKSVLTTPNL